MRYAPICARFCPAAWFPFVWRDNRGKQQKTLELLIYFAERFKIYTKCVCANIFVTLL